MWIKICGVRDCETARQISELCPDAIGLNFYRHSPRHVTVEIAERIVQELPSEVEPVGLFVNASVREVVETTERCAISSVQFHGDEPPEFLHQIQEAAPGTKIIRAFRIGADGLKPLADFLHQCRVNGCGPVACLLDARVDGSYGGTGQTLAWEPLKSAYRTDDWPQLILAGGLSPENVSQAIRAVRPWGVDVASGVESTPGCKDLRLVERFIANARAAFADTA